MAIKAGIQNCACQVEHEQEKESQITIDMKKYIDLLRIKLGMWLLFNPTFTATAMEMSRRVQTIRCIHCGKNPIK